jgi:nucleoid DNA-binding protein
MNRNDIIKKVSTIIPDIKDAERCVKLIFDLIQESLKKKEKVVISSFGTFTAYEKAPALRRNPKTNEKVMTGPRKKVRFKPSKELLKSI